MILAANFPGQPEAHMPRLTHLHIEEAASREWPKMAQHTASLTIIPGPLAEAVQLALALAPSNRGQEIAQRGIATALENALDARRQRIIVSRSQVNLTKWSCLLVQAICMLIAIAMVHSDNRGAAVITMGLFASGVAYPYCSSSLTTSLLPGLSRSVPPRSCRSCRRAQPVRTKLTIRGCSTTGKAVSRRPAGLCAIHGRRKPGQVRDWGSRRCRRNGRAG